ncbi:hypothetical protein UY775_23395 [Escherichia coli]|nr:hypothetical protein [Escherichia coli]MDY8726591.1 hypothetical protein [Escherichia coli]HCK0717248.1 hypothetical protein [Escherichia coli]
MITLDLTDMVVSKEYLDDLATDKQTQEYYEHTAKDGYIAELRTFDDDDYYDEDY